MHYSTDENSLGILKRIYKDQHIELRMVPYQGLISVFLITVSSSEELLRYWSDISNSIAAYYQSSLKSDFERWNIYIIYMCKTNVERGLKFKIENDRFSSRKIVAENINTEINSLFIDSLIRNNITNKDLEIPKQSTLLGNRKYKSNSLIWDSIKGANIRKGKGSIAEVSNILDQLILKLKNEDKEG